MTYAFESARILSIAAFLFFGFACLLSQQMVHEFERYGFPHFRRLVGVLEAMGALGLLVSYKLPVLVIPAAGGLSLLMALGIGVRFRIRDSVVEMMPAAFLLLLNSFICAHELATSS